MKISTQLSGEWLANPGSQPTILNSVPTIQRASLQVAGRLLLAAVALRSGVMRQWAALKANSTALLRGLPTRESGASDDKQLADPTPNHGALAQPQSSLPTKPAVPTKALERLAVKANGRVVFVTVEDIDWIEAADNYVTLHVGAQSHRLRETLSVLETRLAADKFVRISRSTIVNFGRLKELQALPHGGYAVILEDGTRQTLSRRYRNKLQPFGLR